MENKANQKTDPAKVTLYIMYCTANNLPFSDAKGRVFIFTNREDALAMPPFTTVMQLNGLQLATYLEEYYVCGYSNVMINNQPPVEIEKVVRVRPDEEYGVLNRKLRTQMICYNELRSMSLLKSQGDASKLEEEVVNALLGYTTGILRMLTTADLALPAIKDKKETDKITYGAPTIDLKEQGKWLALFTDCFAAGAYVGKRSVPVVHKEGLMMDCIDDALADETLNGIIINPGRESFTISKDMIRELILEEPVE